MGSTGCFVNTVEWMASLVAVQQECSSILCCTVGGIRQKNPEIPLPKKCVHNLTKEKTMLYNRLL